MDKERIQNAVRLEMVKKYLLGELEAIRIKE